jgi:DNA adenine methylase
VIKKYDSPKTYFYCDPPYFKTENYYANHEFGINTHQRLAETLKSIQGKFSLSYYHFENLDEWFPKDEYIWESKEFSKAAMAKSGKSQTKGVELLIMNYQKNSKVNVIEEVEEEQSSSGDDLDFDFSI